MSIARYYRDHNGKMYEESDGDWMRYDDHAASVERERAIRAEAIRDNREKTNAVREMQDEVGRLNTALDAVYERERRTVRQRDNYIATILARIPDPDDLRTVCDEVLLVGYDDAKNAAARLHALLPKEEPRG